MFSFDLSSIPPLISSILFLVLGFYITLKKQGSKTNTLFGLVCLVTFWWQFSWFLLFNTTDEFLALTMVRVGYMGIIFIPPLFYHFYLSFIKKINGADKWLLGASYLASAFFLHLLVNTNYFVSGYYDFFWGYYPRVGPAHPFYLALLSILTFRVLYLLMTSFKYLKKDTVKYQQTKFLLLALIFYVLASTDFLVNYGIEFYPFGFVLILFFLAINSYAITKYNLFETEVFLTELLVFMMGVVLAILPFLMPQMVFKILTFSVFVLFCFFGYYLVKETKMENLRRQEAELVAEREHELRRNAEILAENLRHLNEAKNQFLLSTQHHLRSPLSVVQGYLSMISEGSYGKIPKAAREKIDASLESTKKLIQLVNDLLDAANYQMNQGVVTKEPVDIVKLVSGAVADLRKAAASKDIYLRLKKNTAPIPMVTIDPKGIREAIYNIIDNAIKYTQAGGVTVSLQAGGQKIRIIIADTGIGMEEQDKKDLFGRIFERGKKAKQVNVTGKGIGLYLASQMVIGNGGTIIADSAGRDKGTTFIIELPLADGKSEAPAPTEPVLPVPTPSIEASAAK